MTAPNDVAKQAIIDKVNKAIESEGLSVKHAAQCIGLRPAAISGMRKQKNWKAVGITEWDKARKWTNSGETLIKYAQKHLKESDPVDPELLQRLMTNGKAAPAAAQEIPDHVKETGRRATEEEAEKIVEKTKAIAKEFDVPAHEVAKSPDKAPTHSMIDELKEQIEAANNLNEYTPSSPRPRPTRPPDGTWAARIKDIANQGANEDEYYKVLAEWYGVYNIENRLKPAANKGRFRVKPIYYQGVLEYRLQKRVMLIWWNLDKFCSRNLACLYAYILSDIRQTS